MEKERDGCERVRVCVREREGGGGGWRGREGCLCVCVCERERERERFYVRVCLPLWAPPLMGGKTGHCSPSKGGWRINGKGGGVCRGRERCVRERERGWRGRERCV